MAERAHSIPTSVSTGVIPFDFEGKWVRVIEREGSIWFVGNDICSVLGIADPKQALEKLDDDERGRCSVPTPSGGQEMRVVSEGGLYTLILRSRDATTAGTVPHRFRKWVTGIVLPTIRKTGAYGDLSPTIDPMKVLNDPAAMRGLLLTYSEKVLALQGAVEEMRPVTQAFERIAASDGTFCITDAAKTLQVQPKVLFAFLRSHGWIYTRAGMSQEIAYQDKLAQGLLEHKTTNVTRSDGHDKTVTQVRVTAKGLSRLAKELPPVATLV